MYDRHEALQLVLQDSICSLVRIGYAYLEEMFRWRHVRKTVFEPPKFGITTEELVQELPTW